ncbi:MAG TPA: single-stranded-DNA-specific exonuclease RecJ [Alphaproteobacteria bacterium]|nr:single-stranded-DNA-specific exonuclease RecJ [Alphaproteobacteria bacterium]
MVEGDDEAFLGVERSVTGKRWRSRLDDDRPSIALAQATGLPEIVARVLAGRAIDAGAVDGFLEPRLRDQLPDPEHLRDMGKAAERLARAIVAGEEIAVFGDYDVDGATSAALLARFVRAAGGRVRTYIPDRLKEGYGPSAAALRRLQREGAAVVVTVDCGVSAHAALGEAAAAGVEVIVVDHHLAEPRLPEALAIVNPNRLDESSPHRQLAAVGVTFLLVVAVNRRVRVRGWYNARAEPDLFELLDLVALGTVCDVVPLNGLNRALVVQGLKVLARRGNCGIAALADVARLEGPCEAYHLGFVLGPRVNAGGRVGEADLGVRLLGTDDPLEARAIARQLDAYNRERQAIEASVLADALALAEPQAKQGAPLICVASANWHPGVIGIVAGRLRERFDRPAFVIAFDGEIGRGSGRSANGVDLGAAVIAARQSGLLVNGGGHSNAAGLTVERPRLEALREFLGQRIGEQVADRELRPILILDGALSLAAATNELAANLTRVGPFGVGNPEPRFAFPGVSVVRADVVGQSHIRCILADGQGARLSGIAFRAVGTVLDGALRGTAGATLHLAGRLRADQWRGTPRVQVQIEDAAATYTAL